MPGELRYRCPRCGAAVTEGSLAWDCARCAASYPIVCGIPDFRIEPDPYIGIEEDREKAHRLDSEAASRGLAGLVQHYFDITPEVPSELAVRYARGVLEETPARANPILQLLGEHFPHGARVSQVLEIGCGSGPFLPSLCSRFRRVTAVDVALRWLVVARARLREAGVDADLICACAEALPLEDESYDVIVAANVIEHLRSADAGLGEIRRVLRADGVAAFSTPNRLSLAPDPHVRLWGIGFMPRPWMNRYARLVRGVAFDRVQTRSYFELRALFSRRGFGRIRFVLPALAEVEIGNLGRVARALARCYNRLRDWPVASGFFYLFGPFFQILASRDPK